MQSISPARSADARLEPGETWRILFADIGEAVTYCPECAEREFGTVRAMLYDVVLVTGGSDERHISLERGAPIAKDDTIRYEMDTYQVVEVSAGHDEFDRAVRAEWIGRVGARRGRSRLS